MKQIIKIAITSALCALTAATACVSACSVKKKDTQRNYKLAEVQGFDVQNATNISQWEQVPIVSQDILNRGHSGGEGGQWPLCLSGDNKNGDLMFYGTNVGGLYRSTDGGKSWHKSMKDLLSDGVCDVEIDPNNSNRVACFGTNGAQTEYSTGVYLSDDMGESWNFSQHFPIGGDKKTAESMAFDPSSYSGYIGGSAVLYLSLVDKNDVIATPLLTDETRGLYKSQDGGKTWTRINADLGDGIVKVTLSGRVYVGNSNGLFISDDRGAHFTNLLNYNVTGLDVIGDTAYVLTDHKDGENSAVQIWKVDKSGVNSVSDLTENNVDLTNLEWQKFYVKEGNDKSYYYHFSPSVHKVCSLKVSPADTSRMIMAYCTTAVAPQNVYYSFNTMYSNDGGKNWHSSIRDNERANFNIVDNNFLPYGTRRMDFYWSPVDKNKVWDFQNDFVSSSTDGGNTFLWDSNGINGLCVGGVLGMNIFNSDLIYVGAQDYNGAFSANGGKSWEYVNASGQQWGGHVYGGYAASDKVIFGAQASGWTADRYLAISFDGGKTVVRHNGDPAYKLSAGFKNRLNGQSNFVGYQSFKNPQVLFCGDLRSGDMGQSWRRMSGVTGVYSHDGVSGTLYGVDDSARNIVFSEDDGLTWQVLVRATDINKWWDEVYVSDLAVDSKNKIVYAATDWSKLYKIDIQTRAVEEITKNVPLGLQKEGMPDGDKFNNYIERRLTTVAVDPNYPEIVYVGGAAYGYQSDSGLFRSCDGGKTFYTLTSNSSTSVVKYGEQGGFEPTSIRVAHSGDVWVAGGCLGLAKINAPYETDKTRSVATHKVTLELCCNVNSDGLSVHDNRVAVIEEPKRQGYIFEGWYLDEKYENRYDFAPVTQDITLYAKWRADS